jgi:DNA invertase Pin-like site-specific DNA recombinase
MRAIIYCRKSTDRDDMQVQSLDTQLNWCLDYCKEYKFNLVETILEAKSAKQP